jgi:hypothetical protein
VAAVLARSLEPRAGPQGPALDNLVGTATIWLRTLLLSASIRWLVKRLLARTTERGRHATEAGYGAIL